jgi:hypothetical protein
MDFKLIILFICLSSVSIANQPAAIRHTSTCQVACQRYISIPGGDEMQSLKIKDLEKLYGRKFTLKEKIRIKLLKLSLKKAQNKNYTDEDPGKLATISFIAGILTLGLLVVAFANIITGVIFLVMIPALALVALWCGLRSARSGKKFKNLFGIIVGGITLLASLAIGLIAMISI